MSNSPGKKYGVVSLDDQREMTGLEFVEGQVNGALPLNTIVGTLAYHIVVSRGHLPARRGLRTEALGGQPGLATDHRWVAIGLKPRQPARCRPQQRYREHDNKPFRIA